MPARSKQLTKKQKDEQRKKTEKTNRQYEELLPITQQPVLPIELLPQFIPAFPAAPRDFEFPLYAINGTDVTLIGDDMYAWRIVLGEGKGTILGPNYYKAETDNLAKFCFFITDLNDNEYLKKMVEQCNQGQKKKTYYRCFRKMSTWVPIYRDHVLYLRFVPFPTDKLNHEPPRFFVDDVLEIIWVTRMKQDIPLKVNDERFRKYQELWKQEKRKKIFETISLEELHRLFEEFGCDKKLVKLIEDPLLHFSRKTLRERGGYARTVSQKIKNIMSAPMAALFLFDALVKGVNWKRYSCPGHHEDGHPFYYCKKGMKDLIMKQLREVATEKTCYISVDVLIFNINKYRNEMCRDVYSPPIPPAFYLFDGLPLDTTLNIVPYMYASKVFDLQYYGNYLSVLQDHYPLWMCKMFIGLAWLLQFFEDQKPEDYFVRDFVAEAFLLKVPENQWLVAQKFIKDVLSGVVTGTCNYPSLLEHASMLPFYDTTKKQKKKARKQEREAQRKNILKPPTVDELMDPKADQPAQVHFDPAAAPTDSGVSTARSVTLAEPRDPEPEESYPSDFDEYTESEVEFSDCEESSDTNTFSEPDEPLEALEDSELLINFMGLNVQYEILEPRNRDFEDWHLVEKADEERMARFMSQRQTAPTFPRSWSYELEPGEVDPNEEEMRRITEKLERVLEHNRMLEKRLEKLQNAKREKEQRGTSSIANEDGLGLSEELCCPTMMELRAKDQTIAQLTHLNMDLMAKINIQEGFIKELVEHLKGDF